MYGVKCRQYDKLYESNFSSGIVGLVATDEARLDASASLNASSKL